MTMALLQPPLLSKTELQTVADAIARAESTTTGEIRVSIRRRVHWSERKLPLHQRALHEFLRLGMQKTTEHTGVLLFISMKERKFHIVADEGIHRRVTDGYWEALAAAMGSHFRERNFCRGICEAVAEVGKVLAKEFPGKSNDTNELPNDVEIS